jgi:hypothetical protein
MKTTSLLAAAALATVAAAVPTSSAHAATSLRGTFALQAGSCAGGTVSGSYFRMILHSGSPSGPFLDNSSSACSNQSYTLLAPGSDGGLVTGAYQPQPSPPFDGNGNGKAGRITKPTRFYGVDFAASTNPVDPQTKREVATPVVTAEGGALTADLRAFTVSWNSQQFNQGSPKPDGSLPGNTRRATGTYDARTGAFALQWTSQIQGGPFDGFTGLWHLTGRFTPAGETVVVPTATSRPTSRSTTGAGTTTTTAPRAVTAPTATAGASAAPSATGAAPSAAPSEPGSVPSAAPSDDGSQSTAAAPGVNAASEGGTTRWPWVLVAALLAAGAGGLVLRLRAQR